MIIALAGRRIDAPNAEPARFPQENINRVRLRIFDWLERHAVHTLVCSAACGADLLALDAAGELSIRQYIVLPFPREQFRASSVVDRGNEWGAYFDTILDVVAAKGDLFVLGYAPENETAYLATNRTILELAISTGTQLDQRVRAVVVWDGASRGDDDVTVAFQHEARESRLTVEEISTL